MMRVAYYVRVSSQQQVHDQTIIQQLERLKAHSLSQGWPWDSATVFRDDGYSGATLKRPGLDALRDQIARAAFDRIVVTAPDRLARNYVHQLILSDEFAKAGCLLEFLDRPMSQDPNDQLLLHIRAAVAEYERTLIGERLRRGRQYKHRAGLLLPWSTPPYGYRGLPDAPRTPANVYLEPTEAAIVAEIFDLYLTGPESIAGIAKILTNRGIPSPTGINRWTLGTVHNMLKNPVYAGTVYAGRKRTHPIGSAHSHMLPVGKREQGCRMTPPEDWIEVGHVPAIVTPAQFAAVQERFVVNVQRARRNNTKHQYLLRALVSCGLCHLCCTGQTHKNYRYYICGGRNNVVIRCRTERCAARLIPMQQLDSVVWADVSAVVSDPARLTQAVERAQRGEWLPQELQARQTMIRKAQHSLTQQIDRLTDAYLGAIVGLDEFTRRRKELDGRVADYATQERELQVVAQRVVDVAGMTAHIETFCARIRQGVETATFAQKRFILEKLVARIIVTGTDVEIRYAVPTTADSERLNFSQLRSAYC